MVLTSLLVWFQAILGHGKKKILRFKVYGLRLKDKKSLGLMLSAASFPV
jgi:hypothetical protein